jgi:hypothetical protein
MNHQPKAGRCRACTKLWEDCSALPFHTMPIHSQDGTDAVVICSEFVKSSQKPQEQRHEQDGHA